MDRPRVVDEDRDSQFDPVDAPDAPSFPVPEPYEDGDRGYKPIKPQSGLGDLLRKLVHIGGWFSRCPGSRLPASAI